MDVEELLYKIKEIHLKIRDEMWRKLNEKNIYGLSEIAYKGEGDVSYKIDLLPEKKIYEYMKKLSEDIPLVLVMEGIGEKVLPNDKYRDKAEIKVIVDPLDGSRMLMHDLSSAYILTGVAHNKGKETTLNDVFLAVQTEIPTTKHYKGEVLYATKDGEPIVEEWNLLENKIIKSYVLPEPEPKENSFVSFVKFFVDGKSKIAEIEEEFLKESKLNAFDHQYISTAGQFHMLSKGVYRMVVDIRPYVSKDLSAHPYDLSTALIYRKAGVVIEHPLGEEWKIPLDTSTNVPFIAYANKEVKEVYDSILKSTLKKHIS